MVKLLLIAGSSIFLLLGVMHLVLTLQDLGDEPRNFKPQDAALLAAMRRSATAFHPKINLWNAWLGFHFSHSLGLLMFGGAFLYIGIFYPSVFSGSRFLQLCSILIPAVYVFLSLKFWFAEPAVFSAISTACFILAVVLSNA